MSSSGVPAARARVFLFEAKAGETAQQVCDRVNEWFAKDRSSSKYPNLTVNNVSLYTGAGGATVTVLVDLGAEAAAEQPS